MIGWQTIGKTFELFKSAPVASVPLVDIHQDPAMQPRDAALLPKTERATERADRTRQLAAMTQRLKDNPKLTLDPLYLARVDGRLYVVDGHTRMDAYAAAKRKQARAAIVPMTRELAVMVSKIVNTTPRARELRRRMTNEAWWALLWQLSDHGRQDPGPVARSIARQFGVDKKGPTKACHWIRKGWIEPDKYSAGERDQETGRPYYSAVALAIHKRFLGEPESGEDADTLILARGLEKLTRQYVKLAGPYNGRQRWRARAIVLDRMGEQAQEVADYFGRCDEAAELRDSGEDF